MADQPSEHHKRPPTVDDDTLAAASAVTEALETVERARGRLYDWHQLIGSANDKLGVAITNLRACGHHELADYLEREIHGRNVLPGRWTFQTVEAFDGLYWEAFRKAEQHVRDQVLEGRQHVYEAEMKESQRTRADDGTPAHGHAATPESGT